MNSLELTRHLYKSGMLTKEAAIKILKKRKNLIETAIEKEAEAFFKTATSPAKSTIFQRSLHNLIPIAGLAGLAALGTTAAKWIASSAAEAALKHDVQKSYGEMFKQYPELKDSRDIATQHFNVMAKFAPSLASNPLVAGTFVKGTMGMGGHIGPDTVRMLIESQRAWEDIRERRSPFSGIVESISHPGKMVEMATIRL